MPMQYSKKQKQKSKEAKKELRKEEMKKEKKEPPRYQKNEPVREKDDGEPQLGDYSDEEESAPNKADGLADMMAKILGQNTGNKIPVLAKRKTANMKEIEEDKVSQQKMKKARIERKAEQTKQQVIPDMQTADYERQLKKLATRGVVALFNAIATAKRDATDEANAKENAKKAAKEAANPKTKQLKADMKNPPKFLNDDDFYGENKKKDNKKSDKSAAATGEEGVNKTNWKALKDDYMMDSSLSLKNWDKASSGSEAGSDNDN